MAQLSEQEHASRKARKLRELGINPYPADLYPVTHTSNTIKNYKEGDKVVIAGRLMRKKVQGKAFTELQDSGAFKYILIVMKFVLVKTIQLQ